MSVSGSYLRVLHQTSEHSIFNIGPCIHIILNSNICICDRSIVLKSGLHDFGRFSIADKIIPVPWPFPLAHQAVNKLDANENIFSESRFRNRVRSRFPNQIQVTNHRRARIWPNIYVLFFLTHVYQYSSEEKRKMFQFSENSNAILV